MRTSGILFPVSSLASKYGFGCFSKEAYDFIDFLKESGQSCWQILPLGPTGFGDSPYQPLSAFAGNPYFICLETLTDEGLLTREECDAQDFGNDLEKVDYGALYNNRYIILHKAYERFKEKRLVQDEEYKEFLKKESFWLEDYALYKALKEKYGGKSWLEWDAEDKERDVAALKQVKKAYADVIGFHYFMQYKFYEQWKKLHVYARKQGVDIIGDIPFYVAMDSADSWSHPEVFQFNSELEPEAVAGCPPDAFSATGQLWGNPVYDWAYQKKDGYTWWIQRIVRNYEMFDVLRIDHFHGFDEYYAIPYGEETAENGISHKGPGMNFFRILKKEIADVRIIAEDLGTITPSNEKLMKDVGFPGMKVLQYAFDWSESSCYLTYNHPKNCVVYTGTHDNTPTRDWVENLNDHDRIFVRQYIHSENTDFGGFVWDFIREAYRSAADLCIVPLQDYLVKGKEARINEPGTQGTNWQWRILPDFLSKELAGSIRELARIYGRLPKGRED